MSEGKSKTRCAIYTRKSSEEGLEQEFNSLDAQYDACASYIASQKHEGWKLLSQRYDDGGISGGTMERPGLQRLLRDIDAGLIDMVVIYKIDRLTRSLADFARLVERLEQRGCSFVSVTQAFNTSTSMGRLTLNVLLSFAQFEREVTAERIRDKIAASKKKGLWMGGLVPLGYDPHPDKLVRSLVINEAEAKDVRTLFDLYLTHGNLRLVEEQAKRQGIRSKQRQDKTGRQTGGAPLSRGQIHHMLSNPIYKGDIRHRDKTYPGQHEAIVSAEIWEEVQNKLQEVSAKARGLGTHLNASTLPTHGILKGKLFDETGDRLTPSHTKSKGKYHRYYVSNRLISGGKDPSAWRLNAEQLEQTIVSVIACHIQSSADSLNLIASPTSEEARLMQEKASSLLSELNSRGGQIIAVLLEMAAISQGHLDVQLSPRSLSAVFGVEAARISPHIKTFRVPLTIKKRGVEAKLFAGEFQSKPDRTLLTALSKAEVWVDQLKAGLSLSDIADQQNCSESFIRKRIALAFLSPEIKSAILEGRQPVDLSLEKLTRSRIPMGWSDQQKRYQISRA
ncbi:MAG: recombinase family protein [Marivivens sp.]|nr:recombinase family protein [Marivivens sp.]